MNPINIEETKKNLGDFVKSYQRPLRGKFAVLSPLCEELLALEAKGATSGEIASALAQFNITVSKDTVARFLRIEKQNERKKAASTSPRRVLMPRNIPPGEKQ
jgi:hypothetical protein